MRALLALLVLALLTVALCQDGSTGDPLPESPHASLYIEGMCSVCHSIDQEKFEPHLFVLPIREICLRESCHTPEKIGRSHPVGVDARRSRFIEQVPETLPLEDDELISCGSCHQPHGGWLSTTRCYPTQEPEVVLVEIVAGEERQIPYYKTYFLRVPGDPVEGLMALCNSCHPR